MTLSLFTTAAQNLHQWSECHAMSFGQDNVWTNPVNDTTRGSRGGGRGLENHKFYRFIKNYAIGPLPLLKRWTPWKCWTVLLHGISESYSLMIVFFEKAMITGLPLQNKLRTYKKRRKKTSELCFSQSGLDPPTTKPDEYFLDPRMDIRYRGGRETISLLKTLL